MNSAEHANIGILLYDTARIWRARLDQRLKPLGLSQAKWQVLVVLSNDGDGMIQKELAERIGIEDSTLVRLLDRMTADGWLVRRESAQDRRSKTVHLTDKAHEILKEIRAVAFQLRRELLAGIPVEDLRQSMSVLQRIKERAESL